MLSLRNRLHACAAAWLVVQVVSLSAYIPRDCCAAHRAAHAQPHHQTAPTSHEMHGQMDHAMAHERQGPASMPAPFGDCLMRGTCGGPMAAMLALLSQKGVPPLTTYTVAPDVRTGRVVAQPDAHPNGLLAPPDPPPPRA